MGIYYETTVLYLRRHKATIFVILNVLFAVISVVGQVGQNVSLPLWIGTATGNPNCTNTSNDENSSNATGASMDPYFVLSSASFSFVIIFGVATLVSAAFGKVTKEDLVFPQWQFFLVGVSDALNGVLVVFASPAARTAPFLQSILVNIMIPLTIILRLAILRKKPTWLKLISAGLVLVGVGISIIPVITGMDQASEEGKDKWASQPTASRILWPLCFMLGFFPAALMNVIEELSLKDSRKVNLFYFLFWSSLYQLLSVGALFWVDIVPEFGLANGIQEFGRNYWFAIQCFFGQAGCDYRAGLRGSVFIGMYVVSYIGSGLMLRYTEGATYLAIVQTLVTPLGTVFWSLFQTDDCGAFAFEPHANYLTYFSIGGMVLIVPSILLYNMGTITKLKNTINKVLCRESIDYSIQDAEKDPLLGNNKAQFEESETAVETEGRLY